MINFRILIWGMLLFFFLGLVAGCSNNNELTSGLLAPKPSEYRQGVIQVYAARTRGIKQAVSVHTWISTKRSDEQHYTSYEIIGWRLKRSDSALVVRNSKPDRTWGGNQPELILDYRKDDVDNLIDEIETVVENYPFKKEYQAYPGPNSNTFIATIGRSIPELGLDLPSTAIGKDYKTLSNMFGSSSSGHGVQASLYGLLAISLGVEEGLELNILGLNFEFDLFDLAIELPGVGRIGADPVNVGKKTTNKANKKL